MLTVDALAFRSGDKQGKRKIAEQVRANCQESGFLCVSSHNVPQYCIENVFSAIKSFFSLSLTDKQSPQVSELDYRGYLPIGRFKSADPARPEVSEAFKLYRGPDESYRDYQLGPPVAPNLWPTRPSGFRDSILAYWRELDNVRDCLLQMFALALKLPDNYFLQSFSRPMTNMTLLHYPPTSDNLAAYGVSPHTDSDVLTILYPDPIGGLMIQGSDGEWIPATPKPGEFLVNIGDMMEIWSGRRFISTRHYVVNRSGKDRYAFPYFVAPNPDVVVRPVLEPLKGYDPTPIKVAEVPEYVRALACPHR
jgi:isopenicillin N synthase-like dioxygenase